MGKDDSVVIGYRYFIGFHMVLCHGPVTSVQEIYAGERLVWSGDVTANTTISVNKPELFGGERKEGGVAGDIDIEMGAATQMKNSYLVDKIGTTLPAFRGYVSLICKTIYVAAGSAYIKPWWVRVKNIVQTTWYPATADIDNGSANAAHIIRECLLNQEWGLGHDETDLDDTSFQAFALALYNEGFGLSMLLSNQDKTDKFIQEVLRHVQGVIYTDRRTGKYVIKLIRGDYSIPSLPVFDESNILSVETYDKPSPAELLDEIVVKYRPRNAAKDAAVSFQNLATIESQRSVVSQTVQYPGIDKHSNAARVAARELRQASSKISKVKLKANREAWELNPGDVFVFSWEVLGIVQLVMRVTKIDYGKLESPTIIIDAVEDAFSLSQASYIAPEDTSWEDPLKDPIALTYRRFEEQNWWDISRVIDQANLDLVSATSSYVKYLGIEPGIVSWGFQLWTKPAGGEFKFITQSRYSPSGLLTADISPTDKTSIGISGLTSLDASTIEFGGYAIIDDEHVRIDSINITAGTMNVGRGCNDTVPAAHLAGARVWFASKNQANDFTEYSDGELITGEALVETGLGILDSATAPDDQITVDRRQHKPYPPGRFSFNTVLYPEAFTGVLTIGWVHRNRLQQTAVIVDHEAGSITTEPSVTYTLELYDEDGVLAKTYTGLTGLSQIWTTEVADSGQLNNKVRAVLKSVRGGVDSHQSCDFTVDRAGYGFHYGQYYGGV